MVASVTNLTYAGDPRDVLNPAWRCPDRRNRHYHEDYRPFNCLARYNIAQTRFIMKLKRLANGPWHLTCCETGV